MYEFTINQIIKYFKNQYIHGVKINKKKQFIDGEEKIMHMLKIQIKNLLTLAKYTFLILIQEQLKHAQT